MNTLAKQVTCSTQSSANTSVASTITISGIAVHRDSHGRYSLNDLHKAAGGEQRHQPRYWLALEQTNELINEILNSGITLFDSPPTYVKKGRYGGTYVCKELVYSYAMWISAAFSLAVIRAYDSLVSNETQAASSTTVDDRTPLRGIVNRIMGKYGMTYQAVYKLVHKEFGVRHIDELSPKQTAEAVEYLATKAIEGEFLGKEKAAISNAAGSTLSDAEFYDLVCLWSISHFVMRRSVELREVLVELKSPLAEKLSPGGSDIQYFLDKARDALLKGTSEVVYHHGGHLGWRCELQKMQDSYR